MKPFFLMLSFFTRLPCPRTEFTPESYVKGIKLLPLVGLVTGGLLYFVSFADRFLPESIMGILLYSTYVAITGGLHLDGLADSCDALFSGRDKERMLEIMKDSRSGTFGVLGLILSSAAYIVLLPEIPREALLVFPVIGKCAPAIAASAAPYIRAEGMGKLFSENCGLSSVIAGILFANALGYVLDPGFMPFINVSFFVVYLLSKRIKGLLGGITGDILGFVCEVSQIFFIAAVTAVYSVLI